MNPIPLAGKTFIFAFLALTVLFGCSGDNLPKYQTLDVNDEKTQLTTVESYFSQYTYGNTLKMYQFTEQNVVLKMIIDNSSSNFAHTATLNFFDKSESKESIATWINNQYSDALLANAPDPIEVIPVPESYIMLYSSYINSEDGGDGYRYNNYQVSYSFSDFFYTQSGKLKYFSDSATVHVRVLPTQYDKVLDVNSPNTVVITADTLPGPNTYSESIRFYHFTGQNAVIKIRFPNTGTDFKIFYSLVTFADSETDTTVGNWIQNQITQAQSVAPNPTGTFGISSYYYKIDKSEFIDSETAAGGDNYDNYQLYFSFKEVAGKTIKQLAFSDSIPVHVLTKDRPENFRELDVNDSNTQLSYPIAIFPRNDRYYHFTSDNAVLVLNIYSTSMSATMFLFSMNETPESIALWIHTLYEDFGIYEAPSPFAAITIDPKMLNIDSSEFVQTVDFIPGPYNVYNVTFRVQDIIESEQFHLSAFEGSAVSYEHVQ